MSGLRSRARPFGAAAAAALMVVAVCPVNSNGEEAVSQSGVAHEAGEESVPAVFGSEASIGGQSRDVEREFFDDLWDLPVLYRNPDNPWVQEFRLVGRYHGQYGSVSASEGNWNGWETRRARFGFYGKFLKDFSFRLTYENQKNDKGVEEKTVNNGWVSWRPSEKFGLKLGQQKPLWSAEWSTSSNFILTVERSQLVNQLHPEVSIGAYASGELGDWGYGVGVFSGNTNIGVGGDSGNFTVVNVGRDFKSRLKWFDLAHWRLDWVWDDGSSQLASAGFKHAFSSSVTAKKGRSSLMTNVLGSLGQAGESDTFGVVVMPAYELIRDKLQFVARYQFATGNNDGLVLQKRYEREIVPSPCDRGDRYHAIYGGLNYYIYDHKLKLMSGLEYSNMNDSLEYSNMNDKQGNGGNFSGWTWITGLRMYF